jgi:hypothetical protein
MEQVTSISNRGASYPSNAAARGTANRVQAPIIGREAAIANEAIAIFNVPEPAAKGVRLARLLGRAFGLKQAKAGPRNLALPVSVGVDAGCSILRSALIGTFVDGGCKSIQFNRTGW